MPTLISDLVVIIIAAGLMTLLFKRLKQPVVLGYILAGILAGPAVKFLPTIGDPENIRTWGDIGVIFLLFNLGLDFSLKKLMKVGGTAIIGAITVVIGMMSLGFVVGTVFGLSQMSCLFLGAMLSMSSTTIIFKAFDEMGLRNKQFAGVVFGVLIVEDIFAVLILVLLSTLAVSKSFEGIELLYSIIKLCIFLVACFVFGIYLIPTILKGVKKYLNDETLLIVAIGLCLGLVYVANSMGFSSALGAFVMGAILAETVEAEHIEGLVKPVKDLFAAVFFVSVGMLIDLNILWEYKVQIAILTLAVMFGQLFFGSLGVLLSGKPLRTAIQTGFSLTQIGEFAFIIASQGIALNVMDKHLYPMIVAVSVVTTFFTPYMIRFSEPAFCFIDRKIPVSWKQFLDRYSSGSNTIRQQSVWRMYLRKMSRIVGLYLVISIIVVTIWLQFVSPLILGVLSGLKGEILSFAVLLVVLAPLIRAIMIKKNHSAEFQQLWNDNKYNRGPLVSIVVLRMLICIALIAIPMSMILNIKFAVVIVISFLAIIGILYSKRLKSQSKKLERQFVDNFSAREKEMERRSPVKQAFVNHLLERDLHIANIEVRQDSPNIGKTLKELNFRHKFNVNIVRIIRGGSCINIPGGNERIYPFDKLVIVGSDNEINDFSMYLHERDESSKTLENTTKSADMQIEQFIVVPTSRLVGLSLRDSHIREDGNCLVIGIERGNTSIKNPPAETVFVEGDIVWVVGEHEQILKLSEINTDKS